MDSWYRPTSPMMWPPNPRAPWFNANQKSQITNFGLTVHPRHSRPPSLDREQLIITDACRNAPPARPPSDPEVAGIPISNDSSSSATTATEQSTITECSSNDSQSDQQSEAAFSTDLSGFVPSKCTLEAPQQQMTTDVSSSAHQTKSDQTPTSPPPPPCTTDVSSSTGQSQPDQTPALLPLPPPLPCTTDGSNTNVASLSKSMTMTELSSGIPSPAATYMGEVWSKACGLSSPSSLLKTDEQATSILKYQIIKNIHRLSLRAAYVRLWHIMPPLDTEDPGTGVGEFLCLRNRVVPMKPICKRQNMEQNHCDNCAMARDGDCTSHCSVRDAPVDVMTERTSLCDLLMSPQSDDEDGDGNTKDTFLSGAAGAQMGLPNTQISPKIFPLRSVNMGGDGTGNDASVHCKANILVECETQCHLQAARLRHSDDECMGGNSDYPSFHSARDISMGTNTPCSLPAMSPQQSDREGSSSAGKGSDPSLTGAIDIPTWPASPCPVHAAIFPHSQLKSREGEISSRHRGIDSLVGPATLLPLQVMPADQYEQREDSDSTSSSNFSQKNAHFPRRPHMKPKKSHLTKLSEASLTRSSPSRPSGASASPSSKRGLASAQRRQPHSGNHRDPMHEGTASLLADRRKAFRDTLDWLDEEYELLTDMLYYTEEEWAKIDAISKVYENQFKFSPKSINEADEKDEEVAALQLKVGTDLILSAMEKLKETHSGRKVLRSMAQKFSQNEDEKPSLESSKQNEAMRQKEVTALKMEVESVKDQLAGSLEKLKEAEYEAQVLRSMMQRFVLTEEEMEEIVLKRCWLAHYWGLAVQYDLFPDIAKVKHERWSEVAPLPDEVVTAVGERTKKDFEKEGNNGMKKSGIERDPGNLMGKLNIESMLSVERELRELTALKVEEAVMLEISNRNRRSRNLVKKSGSGPPSLEGLRKRLNVLPSYQNNLLLKLSDEEANDIRFKRAWLIYFWGRAVNHGVEEDTAKDRLQYWISRMGRTPTFQEAVEVGRDMEQLKKLEIELKLWNASRREIDIPFP